MRGPERDGALAARATVPLLVCDRRRAQLGVARELRAHDPAEHEGTGRVVEGLPEQEVEPVVELGDAVGRPRHPGLDHRQEVDAVPLGDLEAAGIVPGFLLDRLLQIGAIRGRRRMREHRLETIDCQPFAIGVAGQHPRHDLERWLVQRLRLPLHCRRIPRHVARSVKRGPHRATRNLDGARRLTARTVGKFATRVIAVTTIATRQTQLEAARWQGAAHDRLQRRASRPHVVTRNR